MPLSVINRLNEMALAEGKKIVRRTKMARDVEGGLETADKPSSVRPTQELTADDVPHNPTQDPQTQEEAVQEFEFDPSVANDVTGYPEDSDTAVRKTVTFYDPDDLDVGELQEFGVPDEMNSTYRDASVPVTPPRASRGHVENVTVERALNITVKEALRSRGAEAVRVIKKELTQMLTKGVWTPVHLSALTGTETRSIIRSQMFLKEKFLRTGVFEKLKARLVAGGNQQNKDLHDDISSPTVSSSAVMTIFAIAAHEGRSAAVIDIGGAFLNADMGKDNTVHMRLDPTMSGMLIELESTYKEYVDVKGNIVVRLDKALYGCVESAALWYHNLSAALKDGGYTKNEYEICVYNKRNKVGMQCTIAVHVDDLVITSVDADMIKELKAFLKNRYGEITYTDGHVLNYLGMVFDLSVVGQVKMTMKGYVDDTITYAGVQGHAASPATDGLFESRDSAVAVDATQSVWFHSVVAKLAYLAKRARPECLTAVAYLATRVTKCTDDDVDKLKRVLKYIAKTRERGVVLRPGRLGVGVRVYVDAAYGVHSDGKSHTGSCVVIGDVGAVHCKSSKQSIVTKSSTEAELVALSDSANQGLHIRNFLIGQGHTVGPMTVYQDNTSCMALVERGRSGAERTRHISIRYFWLRERVDKKEATVVHKGTAEMYANLLTKPLQGAQFAYERGCLTGWI